MVPLFGAAYTLHQIKAHKFILIRVSKTVLIPPVNGKIHGLFKAFECFSSTFQDKFNFQGLFQDSPDYSSTFQACANPVDLDLLIKAKMLNN